MRLCRQFQQSESRGKQIKPKEHCRKCSAPMKWWNSCFPMPLKLLWWVRSVWIHLQLLLRIVRQYRVKYRQGRTAEARQRQSQIQDERSGQAASKHSPGETIQSRGRQTTIREMGNSPRSKTKKANTGITLRNDSRANQDFARSLCMWVAYMCVCKWGAGVDDQSVPGMRNDGKWSPNGNG